MRSSSQIDARTPQGGNSYQAGYPQYAEQNPVGGYPHQSGQLSQHNQNSYQPRVQNARAEDSHVQSNHGASVSRNLPPQFPPAPQNGSEKNNLPALPHSSLSDKINQVAEKGFADFRADAFEDNEVDTQISALFNAMGRASKLSQSQLAMRLQTTEEVVQALEAGRLGMLPDWEEMAPVVVRYAKFMNIDERPILRRLREQLTEHFLQRMTREKKQNGHQTAGFNAQAHFPQGLNRQNELLGNAPLSNGQAANPAVSQESPLPRTDQTLKAIASGKPITPQFQAEQPGLALQNSAPPIEDRLAALVSATSQPFSNFDGGDSKQASSNFAAHSKSLRAEMKQPLASHIPNGSQNKPHNQQPLGVSQGNARTDYMPRSSNEASYAHSNGGQFSTSQHKSYMDADEGPKKKTKWLKIAGNIAFILVLLIGFINWQPNRFWSGVDQLPKPIAKSIYDLFEFVMPDPLASVYRMNWVYVDDPRMRKSDKLAVPSVMKLPKLDFSKIGNMSK